jgi:hypothetical protein
MTLLYSLTNFRRVPNIKFNENTSGGSRAVPCDGQKDRWTDGHRDRQKDRHEEANIRFSKFFERA